MHVRFYLLGFLRALSRPRPVVLQLVKTFPRHRIRSQSGHLSLRFEGKGRLLFFSPFDGARRGKKKKKSFSSFTRHLSSFPLPISARWKSIRFARRDFLPPCYLFSFPKERERERFSSKFRIQESSNTNFARRWSNRLGFASKNARRVIDE